MTSDDKKEDKGFDLEDSIESGDAGMLGAEENDVADTDMSSGFDADDPVESLSAGIVSDVEDDFEQDLDLDIDITGDVDTDFADEDEEENSSSGRGGAGLKKMMAPALVLVVAVGVGGYIVMNPQILGQDMPTELPQPENAYVAQAPQASPFSKKTEPSEERIRDMTNITESASFEPSVNPFAVSLPQPTVNQNEASPVLAEVPDIVDVAPPENMPKITEVAEAVDATATAESLPEVVLDVQEALLDTEGGEVGMAEEADMLADDLFELKISAKNDSAEIVDLMPMAEEVTPPAMPDEGFEVVQIKVDTIKQVEPPSLLPSPSPMVEKREVAPNTSFQSNAQGAAAALVKPSDGDSSAIDADVYFDGRVPTGPLATAVGPRKVDPVLEPATRFVVVKKTHSAKNPEALLVSANRALKLKRYESALEMFDQLYRKNNRDPRILMGRAVAQQNSGLTDSAIKSYEQLLDLKPNNADAMLNMLGLLRQQYPSVALRRLMDLYEKHPDSAGIAAQIGVTQADLGHHDDAMRYLGIASSLEPRNAQHAFNMAIIADRNGDARSAVKHYESALEMDAIYSSGRSIPRETIYDRLSILRRR